MGGSPVESPGVPLLPSEPDPAEAAVLSPTAVEASVPSLASALLELGSQPWPVPSSAQPPITSAPQRHRDPQPLVDARIRRAV